MLMWRFVQHDDGKAGLPDIVLLGDDGDDVAFNILIRSIPFRPPDMGGNGQWFFRGGSLVEGLGCCFLSDFFREFRWF